MADKLAKADKVISGLALIAGTAVAAVSAVKKTLAKFNERGEELVDGRSVEPPVGYERTIPLAEQIAAAVRAEAFKKAVQDAGGETFDEAEDFDVGDDFDPTSPYEAFFEPITEDRIEELVKGGYIVREHPAPKPPAEPAAPPAAALEGPGSVVHQERK